MRAVFAVLLAAGALWIGACAHDGPTAEEVQQQFQRGVSGEGTLTPDIDRRGDPYVKPRGGRAAGG
ncbi:MAG: hypothetical protein H0T11_01125 [Chthoniobacterales bacterium]|nr:hypothetical protein [Chthoniobacterales bacterium]